MRLLPSQKTRNDKEEMDLPADSHDARSPVDPCAASTTSRTAGLVQLPTELIELIIAPLDKNSLVQLSRSCQKLNTMANIHLYKSIHLTWRHDQYHPRISCLLNTLIRRPDLASCVVTAKFTGSKPRGWKYIQKFSRRNRDPSVSIYNGNRYPTDTERIAVMTLLEELNLLSNDLWIADYMAGEVDVFVALIISQLGNLKFLQLSSDFQEDTEFVGTILKNVILSNTCSHGFASLKQIEYGSDVVGDLDMDEFSIDLDQFWPLFHLSSLETLTATCPNQYVFQRTQELSRQSPLVSMELKYCHINSDYLGALVSLTPNLTKLDLHVFIRRNTLSTYPFFRAWEAFADALAPIASTLKLLRLRTTTYVSRKDMPWSEDDLSSEALGNFAQSFRGLTSLEVLQIPLLILLGWNDTSSARSARLSHLIPTKLHTLALYDSGLWPIGTVKKDEALLQIFGPLLEDLGYSGSQLRSLTLSSDNIATKWWPDEELHRLRNSCKDAGIICRIEKGVTL